MALITILCTNCQTHRLHAQAVTTALATHSPSEPRTPARAATGSIAGTVTDPTGAVVREAKVEATQSGTGFRTSAVTEQQGHFRFTQLPSGYYRLTVTAAGFRIASVTDVHVVPGGTASVNVSLTLAPVSTRVEVAPTSDGIASSNLTVSPHDRTQSRNAAQLLATIPGVSLRTNGQLASMPVLHGLGDERVKLSVNGMSVSNACPNHMNPPLSYVAPSDASVITVMAGITPVSMGGDSLGGTISVQSPTPVFATGGKHLFEEGSSSGFYSSNGQNYGGALSEWVANRNFGIGYSGSWSNADDYTDGSGATITSTYAQSTDHTLTLAVRGKGNLLVLRAGLHHIPYQGFMNQRMDMVRNYATSLNLQYSRSFKHGLLDAHTFWQSTSHSMNLGHDKSTFPTAQGMPTMMDMTNDIVMPMNDHGTDLGYSVKYAVSLSDRQLLRIGNELHRFVLNDNWPAIAGMAPMMGPNAFLNINNGHRTRLGTYAELVSKWTPQWTTLIGVRNDTVWSDTGPVHGYSMMYAADADAFNAADRARTDVDADATALVRYQPATFATLEIGYARKTRAPNLYERYSWSTSPMASSRIGWFGDGNFYVGNLNLKPEIAHTVSGTVILRGHSWQIKATPYETHIQDYIDVNTMALFPQGMTTFAKLRFTNHNAGIHGGDLSGQGSLWSGTRFGSATLSGVGSWLHGMRLDTHTGLYQMMPLNLHLGIDESLKAWTAGFSMDAVDRKSNVDPHRFEPQTPGYTLFSVHTGYRLERLQISAAVDNLLNKEYALPLGGVNLDQFMAGNAMGKVGPVTGIGRSASVNVILNF